MGIVLVDHSGRTEVLFDLKSQDKIDDGPLEVKAPMHELK